MALALLLGAPLALLGLQWLPRPRRRLALGCAAAIVPVLVAWNLVSASPPPSPKALRITFLDVGQGDSILLQVPEGAVLVDQGPPEADVAAQLARLGVRRLAALVITHPDRDHVGGAESVLRRLAVDRVLEPGLLATSAYARAVGGAAASRGVRISETRAGDAFRLGLLRVRVLSPEAAATPTDDLNRWAVVLLVSYGEIDALLPGDAETDVTARLLAHPVEIVKVAHHGSADPGLEAELSELRPAVAVISVGRGNDYGHPRASTLAALRTSPGLALYRTDEDGRVVVESDGRTISVRTDR